MADKQELYEKHPELFHYTDFNGVKGILRSQSLRATHYGFLNDSSELQIMRARLVERLFPLMRKIAVERYRSFGYKEKLKIRKDGGAVKLARDQAEHLVESIYITAFEDNRAGPAAAIPYITSFCSHSSDHPYEQKNGLLSQWRGYGKGGYALVFDTKKLCARYLAENNKYFLPAYFFEDVVYDGEDSTFENEFGETIKKIEQAFLNYLETGDWKISKIFGDVLSMFTRVKHHGFYEEREVRHIIFPMTKKIEDALKSDNPDYVFSEKPMKEIIKRDDGALYVETLSENNKKSLPIKRIIVGPQENMDQAKKKVKNIVGKRRINVHCSETPLIWPGDGKKT